MTMDDKLAGFVELRNVEGEFDDLVAEGCNVHVEMLDGDVLWIGLTKGDRSVTVVVSSKKLLKIKVEEE